MDKIAKIRFKGYKSFKSEEFNYIDTESNVGLFIGKNNSGKSSCLDVIESVFDENSGKQKAGEIGILDIGFVIDEPKIGYAFSKSRSGGGIIGRHYDFGCKFIDKCLFFRREPQIATGTRYLEFSFITDQPYIDMIVSESDQFSNLARTYNDYVRRYAFRRVNAERDIKPERESWSTRIGFDGTGVSNLIQLFITHSDYDENLVEKKLLNELNKIMFPDSCFTNIKIQQIGQSEPSEWEVFLEEKDAGRFALSKSGSGLKTILLVLVNLYLIPQLKEYKNKKIVYAFEELENNLHPAVQRKLFDYLYEFAVRENTQIFITSHSNVSINTYYQKEKAKIYHVTKNNNISTINEVENYADNCEILDDLDVKASDLLQTNGIIWVEGPSDRVYINRWLEVFCNSKYKEGTDYQFLYYGGRSLSHYTTEENVDELINILTTNRNAAIVIDSDRRSANAQINNTKKRIRDEFKKYNFLCWITKGKEIENYLAAEAINKCFASDLAQIEQHDLFPEYIKKQRKSFEQSKVGFAHKVAPYITDENSKAILDLKKMILKLHEEIKRWNT